MTPMALHANENLCTSALPRPVDPDISYEWLYILLLSYVDSSDDHLQISYIDIFWFYVSVDVQ